MFKNQTSSILNLANSLTLLRIAFIPIVIYLLIYDYLIAGGLLALLAFVTDYFDGMFARRFGQTTVTGALLDPVADKLIVMAFFTAMALFNEIPWWYVSLIYLRDIAQLLSIPILRWYKKIYFNVQPNMIAKWGTALNFIILAIAFSHYTMLYYQLEKTHFFYLAYHYSFYAVLLISALFEIYILVTYIPRFVQIYLGKHDTFE